jgi:hypothetical protein
MTRIRITAQDAGNDPMPLIRQPPKGGTAAKDLVVGVGYHCENVHRCPIASSRSAQGGVRFARL